MPRRDRFDNSDSMQICSRCGGTGQVVNPINDSLVVCPLCDGVGRMRPSASTRKNSVNNSEDNS